MNLLWKQRWEDTGMKKGKLKQKFPIITDEDLRFQDGKDKIIMEMLGYKLGNTEQELLYIIAGL